MCLITVGRYRAPTVYLTMVGVLSTYCVSDRSGQVLRTYCL